MCKKQKKKKAKDHLSTVLYNAIDATRKEIQ